LSRKFFSPPNPETNKSPNTTNTTNKHHQQTPQSFEPLNQFLQLLSLEEGLRINVCLIMALDIALVWFVEKIVLATIFA